MSAAQNFAKQIGLVQGGQADYVAGDANSGTMGYAATLQQQPPSQSGGRRRRRGVSTKRRGFKKVRSVKRRRFGFLRSRSARPGRKLIKTFKGRFPALFDISKPRISKF